MRQNRFRAWCVLLLLLPASLIVANGARADERALVFGVHPYLPASELAQRFTPLIAYLEGVLARPISLRIGRSYDDHLDAVEQGMVDLAFIGPISYLKLTERQGSWPIAARLSFSGKTRFRGAIIVRRDSDVQRLEELAGRRFAFGDPNSTLSTVVPMALLRQAGVGLNDLGGYRHLSNHENVALGVLMGYYDAGGVKGEVFDAFLDQGLRAIVFTPWISSHLLVLSPRLSVDMQEDVRAALLGLSGMPDGAEILQAIKKGTTALVPATDADYDPLRSLIATHEQRQAP